MIAEKGPELLHTGVAEPIRRPECDRTIRVLQVTRDRSGTQVHPAAEIGMADEAVVRLVGLSEHDRLADLAADDAPFADGAPVHAVAKDGGSRSDRARADESCERADNSVFPNENRPRGHIEHDVRLDRRPTLDEYALVPDNGHVRWCRARERGANRRDIVAELREQIGNEMPNLLDPSARNCRDAAIVRRELLQRDTAVAKHRWLD